MARSCPGKRHNDPRNKCDGNVLVPCCAFLGLGFLGPLADGFDCLAADVADGHRWEGGLGWTVGGCALSVKWLLEAKLTDVEKRL